MGHRLLLQTRLEMLLGNPHVYFQSPPNTRMEYPCIVYKRDGVNTLHANNIMYKNMLRYQLIVISKNPDEDILMKFYAESLCTYDRYYATNGLHHDVFELYF